MAAPRFIFHIACKDDWERQKDQPSYSTETLDSEGFIHCSREEQIPGTIRRCFRKRRDLRILKIDTARLGVPVIYEAAEDGSGFFPHVFGAIIKTAIVEVELPKGNE